MFFRRKSLTFESLDARLSVVEMALELRRQAPPEAHHVTPAIARRGGPLEAALAKLQRAIEGDQRGP